MPVAAPQSMSWSNIASRLDRWRSHAGIRVMSLALVAAAAAALATPVSAQGDSTVRLKPAPRYTGNYIVRWRDGQAPSDNAAETDKRMRQLQDTTGVALSVRRKMGGAMQLLSVANASGEDPEAVAARLRKDPRIADAVPDRWLRLHDTVPNDPDFATNQTYLGSPQQVAGGVNLPRAWDRTRGSNAIVVAVVDTGYLPHPDLGSRIIPGYDFISSTSVSNDGDGRDANPIDAGDFEPAGTVCSDGTVTTAQPSSWHGTRVAGVLGALTNNGINVAGVDWNAQIQPVRVSGRCGAQLSDTVDGMRWAGGLSVPGVPDNPTPARVINVSLGGGTCSSIEQQAITDLAARGVVVVAAAGNAAPGQVAGAVEAPADCAGVIAVTAHANDGENASFANVGPQVAISAPGGGCGNSKVQNGACVGGQSFIRTLSNDGPTVAGNYTVNLSQGTSFATPMVSGVISLMLSVNPSLTPAQIVATLKATARAHPANTFCTRSTTAVCGAGLLDADAAVALAPTPPSAVTTPPAAQPVADSGGGGGGGGGAVAPWVAVLLAFGGMVGFGLRRRG
ncbi:Extracellular basic protease [Cupriavidus pampae]|uniref:Extracellular basic protease n=2 Tax=Cupriavidus pampae TaxID=659251 RepID=A0ABM8XAA8_9BURK|nr:Extracellular basic protease [Cupriavidus pampae]